MWVRGHCRSLKVVPFESLDTVSYSPSIVTMAVSLAISEIFSVKQWPDLEIWVWGSPSPSSLNQMLQLTHQWPVYQLRIIRCSTIIAFGV